MTADQPQEYIITEEQLGELMIEYVNRPLPVNQYIARSKLGDDIRSRPLASHSQQEHWTNEEVMKEIEEAFDRGVAAAEKTIDMQKHDAAIRKGERERVLKKILPILDDVYSMLKAVHTDVEDVDHWKLLEDVKHLRKSLRAGDE